MLWKNSNCPVPFSVDGTELSGEIDTKTSLTGLALKARCVSQTRECNKPVRPGLLAVAHDTKVIKRFVHLESTAFDPSAQTFFRWLGESYAICATQRLAHPQSFLAKCINRVREA